MSTFGASVPLKERQTRQHLHHDGQSIWLDNITRDLLTSRTLREYIDELGITGSPRTRRSSPACP